MDGFEPSLSALTAQRLAIRPHPKIVEYRSNLPKKKAGRFRLHDLQYIEV